MLAAFIAACDCDPRIASCEAIETPGDALISAHPKRGFFAGPIEVELTALREAEEIRYTLDGTIPDGDSPRYDGPIRIHGTATLRASLWPKESGDGVATNTFVIGARPDVPVIAIGIDRAAIFDPEFGLIPHSIQHGDDWERPASIEFLTADGTDQFDAGLRLHGNYSREAEIKKKSLKVYLSREYARETLDLSHFVPGAVEADGFVLRAGFNDSWANTQEEQLSEATMIRDSVARRLYRDMGHQSAVSRHFELIVAGESWGVYELVERYEEAWFRARFGEEDWDIVRGDSAWIEVREGDDVAWRELAALAPQDRFDDPAALGAIEEHIDLESFTDYLLLNIWLQNYDWPRHNWFAARPKRKGGKWIFLPWDTEYSFGVGWHPFHADHDTFEHARNSRHGPISRVFSTLLESPSYRRYFQERLEHHLASSLSAEHVAARYREHAATVEPAIAIEAEIWGAQAKYRPRGIEDWRVARDRHLSEFIPKRGEIVRGHVSGATGVQ